MSHRRHLPAVAALLCAACAGTAPPDWQINAKASLERATAAYLRGNSRIAIQELARARSEVAATGRRELLARVELLYCATRVASLEIDACPAYQLLAEDAAAAEQAYARYLRGQVQAADLALLPPAQSAIAADRSTQAATLASIADPLSRLVAAGVLLRSGQGSPAIVALAVDTAAAEGWRRPLLAWLKVQQDLARTAADDVEAARLQRRIDLLSGALNP